MRSPPEMALTRLATRGDLSQLRWARWQSARSFDAHPLNAYAPRPLPLKSYFGVLLPRLSFPSAAPPPLRLARCFTLL